MLLYKCRFFAMCLQIIVINKVINIKKKKKELLAKTWPSHNILINRCIDHLFENSVKESQKNKLLKKPETFQFCFRIALFLKSIRLYCDHFCSIIVTNIS
jgi:hypothetical protein